MVENIGERIRLLRQALNLTQRDFASKIGIGEKTLRNYESGKFTPKEAVLKTIEQTFSVNPEWLRHGKGEMFLPKPKSNLEFLGAVPFDFVLMPVPVVSDAAAGKGRGLYAAMVEPSEVKLVWVPKKYANHRLFFFRVNGDSMKPRLQDKDWVVADLDSQVKNGDLVVVELDNEEIMVKKYRKKREGFIILESYNPDHEPIIVKPEQIKHLAKVVLIVPNGESPWG
jgi:phage repressor protein C with HTH and peptisase S24 domain